MVHNPRLLRRTSDATLTAVAISLPLVTVSNGMYIVINNRLNGDDDFDITIDDSFDEDNDVDDCKNDFKDHGGFGTDSDDGFDDDTLRHRLIKPTMTD